MSSENSLMVLQEAKIGKALQYVESCQGSVTTAWGVKWSPTLIARDIMQNFFDANRENPVEIQVRVEGADVVVTAPAEFELARLFYLGSEKGGDDIGQYGEGFKAAAVCLLRDHKIEPIAISGKQVVYIRIGEKVPGTKIQPVVYDYFQSAQAFNGSRLILRGCSKDMIAAMQEGLTHFLFDQNPLLGGKLWESWDGQFQIHASTTKKGHVFYRKFKRGEIDDIPVVLVINKSYAAMEKKIQTDRDRNAFGEQLMGLFYHLFARSGIKGDHIAERTLLEASKHLWDRGHPLISAVAGGYYLCEWSKSQAADVFGDKYFALSHTQDHAEGLEFQNWEAQWKRQGQVALPGYFSQFGVLCARDHCAEIKRKAFEESKALNHRKPSPCELSSLEILRTCLQIMSPAITNFFKERTTSYSVAETEAILGELKSKSGYGHREVFLASSVFVSDFAAAFSIFLHEHSHIFGYDGSRGFSDELTKLMEIVIRYRDKLQAPEAQWNGARKRILQERAKFKGGKLDVGTQVGLLTEIQLRELVNRLPAVAVQQALNAGVHYPTTCQTSVN
jgi:hypothetical protein